MQNISLYNAQNVKVQPQYSKRPVKFGESLDASKTKEPAGNFEVYQSNIANQPQTTLITEEEKQAFSTVYQLLSTENKQKLNELLQNGKLLDKTDSNDNSSVLENLHKIATKERVQGLDKQVILNETINILHNPFIITQKFGDIPQQFQNKILSNENKYLKSKEDKSEPITKSDMDIKNNGSSCCVAASIEFKLAHTMPAEFTRMVEGLTSPEVSVEKTIATTAVSMGYVDAISALNDNNANPKYITIDKVKLKLEPDRNAIIRARIQNSYKDPGERSLVDVLMQSMIMNIGAAKTYNSLTDHRDGIIEKGLSFPEKTFAECVVTGKNNCLIEFQLIDDNMKLLGYAGTFDEMKKYINDSLDTGENIIIGYTEKQDNGTIGQDGHELTIFKYEKDKNGNEYFVCNDTDRDQNPIKYEVNELMPQIHHAGIPYSIVKKNNGEFQIPWQQTIEHYHSLLNGTSKT